MNSDHQKNGPFERIGPQEFASEVFTAGAGGISNLHQVHAFGLRYLIHRLVEARLQKDFACENSSPNLIRLAAEGWHLRGEEWYVLAGSECHLKYPLAS